MSEVKLTIDAIALIQKIDAVEAKLQETKGLLKELKNGHDNLLGKLLKMERRLNNLEGK